MSLKGKAKVGDRIRILPGLSKEHQDRYRIKPGDVKVVSSLSGNHEWPGIAEFYNNFYLINDGNLKEFEILPLKKKIVVYIKEKR